MGDTLLQVLKNFVEDVKTHASDLSGCFTP